MSCNVFDDLNASVCVKFSFIVYLKTENTLKQLQHWIQILPKIYVVTKFLLFDNIVNVCFALTTTFVKLLHP